MIRASADLIGRAGAELAVAEAAARRVFLIVHPLDHMTVEVAHADLTAPEFDPPQVPDGVYGISVLCVPDHLTVWSARSHCWYEMMFRGFDPTEPPDLDDNLSLLPQVEAAYLARIGYEEGSPYLFGFSDPSSEP